MHYVFGHHDKPAMAWTPADEKLGEMISSFWVNFAKSGNPNGSGLPNWPVFTGSNPVVMCFDNSPHASTYPNLQSLQLWEKYYAWRCGEIPAP
jgi:para-nitrobenzyl esterase